MCLDTFYHWNLSSIKWNKEQNCLRIPKTDKHERRIQKINSFNKIHVKHQNTEMAKKEKKISFCFFFLNFVQITVVQKYYKFFSFQNFFFFFFFFFLKTTKHIFFFFFFFLNPLLFFWFVVFGVGVFFCLPFTVIHTITWAVNVKETHPSQWKQKCITILYSIYHPLKKLQYRPGVNHTMSVYMNTFPLLGLSVHTTLCIHQLS